MGKSLGRSLAKRDDPIFSERPTSYTRPSDRGLTASTPGSPKTPAKASDPGSKGKASKGSNPEEVA